MFEIKNVSKKYGNELALDNVSLNIGKGMNFIVGASGSGKTTLLKIISGLEKDFDGEVFYNNLAIKKLNENEQSYLYNNVFGFVWQEFNLLESATVFDNVQLPQLLKENHDQKLVEKILKELKIWNLAATKVKYLSGGQKQRVALARELMKNPDVIIADEPTSALDEKSSHSTIELLRSLSKKRMVIVVTHDTSMINKNDHIYELDKAELIEKHTVTETNCIKLDMNKVHNLSNAQAFSNAIRTLKNQSSRFIISAITIVVAAVLLLTTLSGSISKSSAKEFTALFDTYGDSLTDIGIYRSFSDAAGTGGEQDKKPSGDVTQKIGAIYDQYAKDSRLDFIAYLQPFDKISVDFNGKKIDITSSGNMTAFNKIVTGRIPNGNSFEVAVPESFAKNFNKSNEDILNKEINFNGSLVDWTSGSPIWKATSAKVKIVGVLDTNMTDTYEGKSYEYSLDDAFVFSKSALVAMHNIAGLKSDNLNFIMRANSPENMIKIKDELSSKGIVPLGHFELIEDIVRLNEQTMSQSGSATTTIAILSIIMVCSIFLLNSAMRKKEMAILKVSGFKQVHLFKTAFAEIIYIAILSIVLFLGMSPLINMGTTAIFNVNILSLNFLTIGCLIVLVTALIGYGVTCLIFLRINIAKLLKTGDH